MLTSHTNYLDELHVALRGGSMKGSPAVHGKGRLVDVPGGRQGGVRGDRCLRLARPNNPPNVPWRRVHAHDARGRKAVKSKTSNRLLVSGLHTMRQTSGSSKATHSLASGVCVGSECFDGAKRMHVPPINEGKHSAEAGSDRRGRNSYSTHLPRPSLRRRVLFSDGDKGNKA